MRNNVLLEMQKLAGIDTGAGGPGQLDAHFEPERTRRPVGESVENAAYRVSSRSSYGLLNLLSRAVYLLQCSITAFRTGLESVAYPDPQFAKSATAIRDGALQDLEDLVKTAGYALDSDFASGWRYRDTRNSGDCGPSSSMDGESLSLTLLSITGGVAQCKALFRASSAKLKSLRVYDGNNPETIQKALTDFSSKAEGLVDKLQTALENLAAEVAKAAV